MDFIIFRTGRSHRLLFQRRLLQVKSYSARFKNTKTEQREAPSVRRPLLPSYSSECLSEKRKQKLQGPTKISAADFKCDTWGLFAQFPHVVDGCGGVEPPGSVVVLQTGLRLDLDSDTFLPGLVSVLDLEESGFVIKTGLQVIFFCHIVIFL